MFDKRVSGILLHPTSFPSNYGIGDIGREAYKFIDFLADSKQQIWQILPLGPTGYGNSPYLCYSAIAGNPLLISIESLQESNWLTNEDFEQAAKHDWVPDYVDFEAVKPYKMGLLEKAHQNFQAFATVKDQEGFQRFCIVEADWLEDYALYMAIKEAHQGASWYQWDIGLANRDEIALSAWQETLKERVLYHKFLQYIFVEQWTRLKAYANQKNVLIFGDIPIYVAHDSVDVWAHPENFCLDPETGEAALMSGVPPDYFSETGQLWGNPVYNWEKLEETGFSWWIERIKKNLSLVDMIRIDHFRGFEGFWAVPQGEKTAQKGKWMKAPGEAFFTELKAQLGDLPIIAEDLGLITPDVEHVRDLFGFPGMKILQFAFDSERDNIFLPFNYHNRRSVVYTGTHDNDTTVGWFYSRSSEEQARVVDYLGCISPRGIHWSLIQLALGSVANLAIFPLQDILGLGTDARMNIPGQAERNWDWRYRHDTLRESISGHLAYLTYLYGRSGQITERIL